MGVRPIGYLPVSAYMCKGACAVKLEKWYAAYDRCAPTNTENTNIANKLIIMSTEIVYVYVFIYTVSNNEHEEVFKSG